MEQSVAEWECRGCGWFGDESEDQILIQGDADGYQYLTCPDCYSELKPGLKTINRIDSSNPTHHGSGIEDYQARVDEVEIPTTVEKSYPLGHLRNG